MSYNNIHKYFLRYMMQKGVITEREAKKVIVEYPDEHHYELLDIVTSINNKIRSLGQELKHVKDELRGEAHIVITWVTPGEAGLSQGLFSQYEVAYWRKLLEEIVITEGKKIGGIQAMNLADNITKTRAQELMTEWQYHHYLDKLENGDYILGLRAVHEFEPYLRQNFSDALDNCELCRKFVFQSVQCNNCEKYFHKHCLNIALGKMNKWPCCKEAYKDPSENQLTQNSHLSSMSQDVSQILSSSSADESF